MFRSAPPGTEGEEPEVRISYRWRYSDSIDETVRPPDGKKFLTLALTIENMGYDEFPANPFTDIFIVVENNSHNASAANIFISDSFQPTRIANGHKATGNVLFEVPNTATQFQPGWRAVPGHEFKLTFVSQGETA